MNRSISRRLSLLAAAAFAGAAPVAAFAGCSSSYDDTSDPVASTATADAATKQEPATPTKDITFPDAGAADDEESADAAADTCASSGRKDPCMTCCSSTYGTGTKVLNGLLLACACKAENCKTACADAICATTPMAPDGGTCVTCVQSSMSPDGGCSGEVSTACLADPECKALISCQTACEKLQ